MIVTTVPVYLRRYLHSILVPSTLLLPPRLRLLPPSLLRAPPLLPLASPLPQLLALATAPAKLPLPHFLLSSLLALVFTQLALTLLCSWPVLLLLRYKSSF